MIRLIIFAIGLFLLWLLFASGFSKRNKIIFTVVALTLAIVGAIVEGFGETPRFGMIQNEQIVVCGVQAEYSYRSNYNITFCLKNTASTATTQRVTLRFAARDCTDEPCRELDAVEKQLGLVIAPGEQLQRVENLAFDKLNPQAADISWQVVVLKVKAN